MSDARQTLSDIVRKLNKARRSDGGDDRWPLGPALFLSDRRAVPEPRAVIRRLPRGSVVILRDYDDPARRALAGDLAAACRAAGQYFLVGADAALARAVGAAGVHLPEGLMGRLSALRARQPRFWLTVACHGPRALRRAARLGADAALVSPVFPTRSHPETLGDTSLVLGPRGLRRIVCESPLPVYALGGITARNAPLLRDIPLAGYAAIRGYLPGEGAGRKD